MLLLQKFPGDRKIKAQYGEYLFNIMASHTTLGSANIKTPQQNCKNCTVF
jgi:hypothetical protein